ncbi:M48 family metallopeptidase, partial [Fusobacterium necrophorum]|uniref:M48 family metallopeptidase n=3 Tax=Fusobacterium necrophorum TaxID=859 RepID=UPI0021BF0F37
NFTNIGAVIGSESEMEKLKVSANQVVVQDVEDKNQYENMGGGISIGTSIPNISIKHDKIEKEQINRATAANTEFEISGKKTSAEDLGFNTDIEKAQEKTKEEEKHLDAELHTDLLGKDKQEELKKAGGIIGDIGTAFTSTDKTRGDFLERYKQASMMRAIGEQVEKNPEYLSILEKEARKNGKIDDTVQIEQVSVMNKLLNDALRAKGYKGPDVKMVLTDVTDPVGPYYTDPLTNVVVFDRNMLANANREELLNVLGHEFGHYSKEDDKDKSQEIANHTGNLLEDRTKGMVGKEASEETLATIRNNKNVITGEEGKKLAESIPMERREYITFEWSSSIGGSIGAGGNAGVSYNKSIDFSKGLIETYQTATGGYSLSTADVGMSAGFAIYPFVNSSEELKGRSGSIGIDIDPVFFITSIVSGGNGKEGPISIGGEIIFSEQYKFLGLKVSISKSLMPVGIHTNLYNTKILNLKKGKMNNYDHWKTNYPRGGKNGWR